MKTNYFPSLRHGLILATLCVSLASSKADPLDNWTSAKVNTNPVGGGLFGPLFRAVTYGNGRFVAVGQYPSDDNATIQTSEDGTNWTLRTHGNYSILDLYDVTCGNNLFVAVGWDFYGGQNIYSSPNGIDWTPHTTSMINVYAVAFGGGKFVAVGDGRVLGTPIQTSQNIYVSDDGTNWSATDSGFPFSLNDVAYGSGRFVAVSGGYIHSSSDGYSWSRTTNSQAGNLVSFCNGHFFISRGAGINLISTDGLNWSALTNNTASTFGHVIYVGGLYVALTSGKVFSSADGTNWLQRGFQSASATMTDLTFGNGKVVLSGYISTSKPVAYASDPFVSLNLGLNFPPQLTVSGLTGHTYRVDVLVDSISTNWQVLTNLTLTNAPIVWTDSEATNDCRFYRAALLP